MRKIANLMLLSALFFVSLTQASSFIFSKYLVRGSSGPDVQNLQEFLKTMPDIYPEGLVTGYFGLFTENAVKKYQAKHGISQTGTVGPLTRAKLNIVTETSSTGSASATTGNTNNVSAFSCPGEMITGQNSPTLAITNGVQRTLSGAEQNWVNINCQKTMGTDAYRKAQIASFTCPEELRTRQGFSTIIINGGVTREAGAAEQNWIMENCGEVTQGVIGQGWTYNQPVVSKLPSCVGNELLSVSPMDPSVVKALFPLGHIVTPRHVFPMEHMEYGIPQDAQDKTIKTDVLAPGAVHIIGIRESLSKKNGVPVTDNPYFSIAFTPCKDVLFYFEGMNSISDALKQATIKASSTLDVAGNYDTDPNGSKMLQYRTDYVTKPGEIIGSVGGPGTKGGALEWGGRDFRITKLGFLGTPVPDTRVFYAICPVDYFPEPLKSQLYSKFLRTASPRCGQVMQDLAGTIQGNWLGQGYSGDIGDTFLSFVHHNLQPNVGIVAISGYLASHGAIYFNPQHSGVINREPSEVKADGQIYCYQNGDKVSGVNIAITPAIPGRVLVQLQADLSVKAEQQNKTCAETISFSLPKIYKR